MATKMTQNENLKGYTHGNRRGYYIYGKDFFTLPNRYWIKSCENDEVVFVLKGTEIHVSLDREYLVPTLRKPADCGHQIRPEPDFFVLSIPDEPLSTQPESISNYVKYTRERLERKDIPAINLYRGTKRRWFSHIWHHLKRPFGAIVIPEKFRPFQRGVAAHYINQQEKRVAIPVTFYTRSAGSPTKDLAIVAWLNSTIGLAMRYKERAWLSNASERLSGEQIDRMQVLNVHDHSNQELARLGKLLLEFPPLLPDFKEQLKEPFYSESVRSKLDSSILEMLGVKTSKIDEYRNRCIGLVGEWIHTIENRG